MRWLWTLCFVLLGCGGPSWAPAPTQVRSRSWAERSEPFFAAPWPDDRRLVDGGMSLRRFPRPGAGALLDTMLKSGERAARGFGLSSPIYVPVTGAIDPSTLPANAREARDDDNASVIVVAVDPASPAYGKRHPVDFRFIGAETLYLPGNILVVRPYPGQPLEESTTYAVIVTKRVKDVQGVAVGPEEGLWNALHQHGDDPSLAKVVAFLDAKKLPRDDVAGAFVFTTQPIVPELFALRDWLEARADPTLDGLRFRETRPTFHVFEGTYQAPYLQHGDVPFSTEGGDFQYDATGAPIPAYDEAMRVSLCVPKGAPPAGGFPVVLYSHGTGGDYLDVVSDICADLAQVGIAAASIDQVFTGPRARGSTAGCFGQPIEVCFFNPVNVVAGRNNTRQAALDNVTLRKMLLHATVPATLHPEHLTVAFAAQRVGFFGHSQGGLTGALYAALEKNLAGAVLSGAGGNLTTTILERKDPFDVRAFAEGPLILAIEGRESLDPFHPAMAMVQAMADMADPSSYARYWVKRPQGPPKHLYVTNGLLDPYTPPFTAEVMTAAAGVPQEAPAVRVSDPHAVAGVAPISAPVQDDVMSEAGVAVTAVFRQFPGEGHFPVFYNATAHAQWRAFFDAVLHGKPVVIPAP